VRVRRDYKGWDPSDPLDPEAESVLAFLDRLAVHPRSAEVDEVVASIDEYGVVRAEVPLGGSSELFLQAGDGWDRVLWTCPSGRTHEWTWRQSETRDDILALLAGRGVERTTLFRRWRVAVELVLDGRSLATAEGRLRLAVLRHLRVPLSHEDAPAL
jgi:hypothetical protein